MHYTSYPSYSPAFPSTPIISPPRARSVASYLTSRRARARRRVDEGSIVIMQHTPTYPGQAHIANHTPILPAAGMADAYRLASLSAGSMNANGGQNAEAGPSHVPPQSASAGLKRKSSAANGRRKRASGTEDSGDGQPASAKARDGPKKKKAARACFHCQKAHLTCDDGTCRSLAGCV